MSGGCRLGAGEAKAIALSSGAHICGIAPLERFADAPLGFHPLDIFESCRSVLVYARRTPSGPALSKSRIPYTFVNASAALEIDLLTLEICRRLEDAGLRCVPIPSDDPCEHWEADRSHAIGLLSLRHAGRAAGLGFLGRSTLLINEQYGNMIQLGAVLLDAALEGDPPVEGRSCPDGCSLCISTCPQGALDGVTVDQSRCRPLSNSRNERGFLIKRCNACRTACPLSLGKRGLPASTGE
jgi:epoxyqueuosine reductase QueG